MSQQSYDAGTFSTIGITDLLVILDVTRRMTEQRVVQPLLEYVAETVLEVVAAERCLIVLFGEGDAFSVQVASSRAGVTPLAQDDVSRSILRRVQATLTPLLASDALNDKTLKTAASVVSLGIRSVICVPLISYGQAMGAIYVENRSVRGQFREEHLIPLILLSHQAVVALENAQLYEALEARIAERTRALQEANGALARQADALREQSIRDALTNLYNRRHFQEALAQRFAAARRDNQPLALACLDIDDFKQINDRFLHEGGDQVLVQVARLLAENIRGGDILARIGGEEFALLMPNTPAHAALSVCERLRAVVRAHDWSTLAPEFAVTLSVGVAQDTGCADAHELLRLADVYMYRAKHLGKNRVVGE